MDPPFAIWNKAINCVDFAVSQTCIMSLSIIFDAKW